ncbi:phosphate ABC transporter permease PstA [Maricaulis sp.]|uniref:phosphate ABC transporter permease PstA n=1 Tax=Maricaulis sp. TaxID=1486257 RepID=UPI002617EFE9|nr:phosphate ABC transporter permease PstA [Maricaulis sp.]
MTDQAPKTSLGETLAERLPRRYRAELRFRAAGLGAVISAVAILLVLILSIVSEGLPAFTVHQLVLPVSLERELVDQEGDGTEASLRRGRYSAVLQNAMREEFPEVSGRRELRALFGLYTPLNSTRLMDEVLADPALVGSTHVFRMPIADELDLYLKGRLVQDRILPTTGTLGMSEQGGVVLASSSTNAFADLAEEMRRSIELEADRLLLRAESSRRAMDVAGEDERDRLASDAARAQRQAEALLDAARAETGWIELEGELPSILVDADGHTMKLSALSVDGRQVRGAYLLGSGNVEVAQNWSLYVVDTPETRRRVSDQVIAWTRALEDRGRIQRGFNHYLFANADSREPELAGVRGALFGSILTMIITMFLSVPIGVFTALYLEEYAPKNRFTDMIEVNINNLAAVPSIVFGLLGLAVFINAFGLPRSTPIVGGLVLSLMTLPTVIISTRAALKAVPPSIRQAALAVGASKTQTVFHHVLPLAAPGILTGSIIGLAQALGETAPLLMIGMVAFIADAPSLGLEGFSQPATVMPVQIFLWSDAAERAFEARTAAAILVLLALMIGFNALAIYLRRRFERRW